MTQFLSCDRCCAESVVIISCDGWRGPLDLCQHHANAIWALLPDEFEVAVTNDSAWLPGLDLALTSSGAVSE